MIVLHNVVKTYETGALALDNVSIHVPERDFAFLVGPSGAGKSTLLRLLTKDQEPSSGSIFVDGMNITRLTRREIPGLRRRIGVIFQDFKLLPDMNVTENVEFALKVIGEYGAGRRDRVAETLDTVGLSHRANYYPYQLSGGEQQRVAIARCLAIRAPVVVADEPTGNLDLETGWETIQLLAKVNEEGTTVVVATHNQDLVNRMQRHVIALVNGRVVRDEMSGGYDE